MLDERQPFVTSSFVNPPPNLQSDLQAAFAPLHSCFAGFGRNEAQQAITDTIPLRIPHITLSIIRVCSAAPDNNGSTNLSSLLVPPPI